jgi:hypothetical protein
MGLLDALRDLLGGGATRAATRDADAEALFDLSTGYVTMAAELDFEPAGAAGLCFGRVDSTDFRAAVAETREVLAAGAAETGTAAAVGEDAHGYLWVVCRDDDFEDLLTSVHFAADTLIERGYGDRLLAAVFGFERARGRGREQGGAGADATRNGSAGAGERVYWIYSFRRGTYYPFAPRADRERDERLEFKLEAVLDGELAIEDDRSRRFPLWPDRGDPDPWPDLRA